ncbi:glycosyltransferase [Microbacterium phosphatis]|uniref:glycosyltransferase n=1 Tax=Microbacterium phosphatis TaxID=3140248 RepID=UPI003140044E
MPPHLLYVAWGYPPSRGSGVYRAWATANEFARAGWRVTVLTVPRETFTMSTGVDLTLEQSVEPSIRIERVPFSSPAFDTDLRGWSWARAHVPELWNGWSYWRGQRSFPEKGYGGWRRTLESAARRIHKVDPVDLVIGTANPNVDFIPGWTLHAEHGVPYVMDNRDAWSLDIYSGRRIVDRRSRAGRWEQRLLEKAHEVWYVNDPIREWHAEQFPESAERMHVVQNGYDVELDLPVADGELPRASLTFGYIGTISAAIPVAELVDGWRRARERSPLVAASRLHLYGYLNHLGIPGENMTRAMSAFEENDIHYLGPVPRAEVGRVYGTFDALVLTFGAGRYITGGKVYEYASTGLPIVSVHDPVNETSRILADHPGWHGAAGLEPDQVADAIIATAEDAATQTAADRGAVRESAQRFARGAQLQPRIRALREAVEARAKGSKA